MAVLQGAFADRLTVHRLPGSTVTVDLLMDDPGHIRLPIIDDEIVDRALEIHQFRSGNRVNQSPAQVSLVTFDTRMVLRAREYGLSVRHLADDDLSDEAARRDQVKRSSNFGKRP